MVDGAVATGMCWFFIPSALFFYGLKRLCLLFLFVLMDIKLTSPMERYVSAGCRWIRRWFEVEDRVLYCYNAQDQDGSKVKRAAVLYQASVKVLCKSISYFSLVILGCWRLQQPCCIVSIHHQPLDTREKTAKEPDSFGAFFAAVFDEHRFL